MSFNIHPLSKQVLRMYYDLGTCPGFCTLTDLRTPMSMFGIFGKTPGYKTGMRSESQA